MIFIHKRIAPMFLMIATTAVFILFFGAEPVHADEKVISSVSVNCAPGVWYILPEKNGTDNYNRLSPYISVGGEGVNDYSLGNVTSLESDGVFYGVNNDAINPEKNYYLSLEIVAEDGYVWPDEVLAASNPVPVTDDLGLRVFFNGSRCTDAYVKMYLSDPYITIPIGNDISAANVSLSKNRFIYNGKRQVPSVTKVVLDKRVLTSKNYKISYHDMSNQVVSPVKPGKYNVWLEGKGIYTEQVLVPFEIVKPNPMKAKGKTVTIKYKKLKKKSQIIRPGKGIVVKNAQGAVTVKLAGAKKNGRKIKLSKAKGYFKISAGTGKIKVKKKLKKGTYTLKVKAAASGNADYGAVSKTITVKIKIK